MSDYESVKKRRAETDYMMPMWLPFLPIIVSFIGAIVETVLLLSYITYYFTVPFSPINSTIISSSTSTIFPSFPGLLFSLFISMFVSIAFGIVVAVLFGYVIYRLIKRFNDHTVRMKALFQSVNQDGRQNAVIGQLDMLPRRDPTLWAILIAVFNIIPYLSIISLILILYIFHSLNKDYVKIEGIENNGFSLLGWKGDRYHKTVDRSTALYIVLTIITFGIFMLYWIYTVAKDPNEHFWEDWRIEDSISPA